LTKSNGNTTPGGGTTGGGSSKPSAAIRASILPTRSPLVRRDRTVLDPAATGLSPRRTDALVGSIRTQVLPLILVQAGRTGLGDSEELR